MLENLIYSTGGQDCDLRITVAAFFIGFYYVQMNRNNDRLFPNGLVCNLPQGKCSASMHKDGGQSRFLSLLCSWTARTEISPVALGLTGVMKLTRNLTKFRKPLPIYLIRHRVVAGFLSGRADCKLCRGHLMTQSS